MKLIATLFLSLFFFTASTQNDANAIAGDWEGTLSVTNEVSYKLIFHISKKDNGSLSATLDSPDQSALGMPFDEVTFKDNELIMKMNMIQGTYKATLEDGKLNGTWSQSGQEFTLNLEKAEK